MVEYQLPWAGRRQMADRNLEAVNSSQQQNWEGMKEWAVTQELVEQFRF